jgi:membrane protease YdiL (CAAX protease family)
MADISIPDPKMRRQRLVDLLLVLAIAFSQSLVLSVYLVVSRDHLPDGPSFVKVRVLDGILTEVIALALLICLISRQGRSLRDIGFQFAWKDIPRTILLSIVSYASYYILYYLLYWVFWLAGTHATGPANVEFLHYGRQGWNLLVMIPFSILNPFFEELIVRAYLITEVEYLTGKTWLAVLISVVLQSSYHLYQGVFSALAIGGGFLIYSLYFAKVRRITPVIFSHMIDDLAALFYYRA